MILLDTCVMVFDALSPEKLSRKAQNELEKGRQSGSLACSDISLWEIAMLMSKGRLKVGMPPREFLNDIVTANRLLVLLITTEIACHASYNVDFIHGDPADRIIAATALHHKALLLTCDSKLQEMRGLKTVW